MAQTAAKSSRALPKESSSTRKILRKGKKPASDVRPSGKKAAMKERSTKSKSKSSRKGADRVVKKVLGGSKAKQKRPAKKTIKPGKKVKAAKIAKTAKTSKAVKGAKKTAKTVKIPVKPRKVTSKSKVAGKNKNLKTEGRKSKGGPAKQSSRKVQSVPTKTASAKGSGKKSSKGAGTRIEQGKARPAKRVVKKLPPKIIRAPIVPPIITPQVDKKAVTEAQKAAIAAQKRAKAALKGYEQALKLFYRHEYAEAKKAFERILGEYGREVEMARRIDDFIRVCDQRLETKKAMPRDLDGLYNAGVFALNAGNYDLAVQYLERAEKLAPRADHVLYSLAAALAQKGETDQTLKRLRAAMSLRPDAFHHVHARRDPDFRSLLENEAFRQLVGYDYESETGED